MKKLISATIFVIFLMMQVTNAQKITQMGDVDISGYPHLNFEVNVYDPVVKSKKDFNLKENNKSVEFQMEHLKPAIKNPGKVVLILVEDMTHRSHTGQRETFRYILNRALPGFVKKTDKVNIAVFDRNRDGTTPLRFLLPKYTNDSAKLIRKVNSIKTDNPHFSNQVSSDLYNAIYDGITELKNKFPDKNKILVVFSAGKNLDLSNYNSIETLNQYAKKEKVAVYSMQYMIWEHVNIDVLAHESFGKVFHIQDTYPIPGDHSKKTAADSLVSFMDHAVSRLYGQDYKISYTTSFPRDGNLHSAVLSVDNSKLNIQFKSPVCNTVCLFKKHPYLYGGIAFVILLLLLGILIFTRKKKKKKERALREKIEAMKREAEEAKKETEEKLKQQKEELERKEKEKERQRIREKQQKQAKEKGKFLISRMKQLGGFPHLEVTNANNQQFVINKPVVTFGRKPGNDYVLNDEYVSGSHFKIFFVDDLYVIEDLKSRNGTKVNGQKVIQKRLNDKDVIEAGGYKMIFRP